MGEPPRTSNDLAVARTDLALDRTVMAAERTVMAWGRTGLSQIALGLSLFKFLELMKSHRGRGLALLVILLGIAGTLIGIIDYINTVKRLNRNYGATVQVVRYQVVMVFGIALFGALVLVMLLVGWLS
jgi:putative membrane protein